VHPFIFRLPAQALLLRWLLFGRSAPAALINGTIDSLRSVDPGGSCWSHQAALTVDATGAFMRCPAPILYLGGTQDRLISSQTAERLKALRPDLEMHDGRRAAFSFAAGASYSGISNYRVPSAPLPIRRHLGSNLTEAFQHMAGAQVAAPKQTRRSQVPPKSPRRNSSGLRRLRKRRRVTSLRLHEQPDQAVRAHVNVGFFFGAELDDPPAFSKAPASACVM